MKYKFFILLFVASICTGLAQESYTLSEGSTLKIDGTSTLHDWTVTATQMEGSLTENGDAITAVDFSVPVADIKSDRAAAMDKKMHEALKKEEHPQVSFMVDGASVSMGANQELKGMLSIAGVENEVAVPVSISEKDGKLQISGEKKIVLADYGMERPSAMFGSIVVGEDVTVKFDLMFAN